MRRNDFSSYAYGICAVSDCPDNETINYPINYTIDLEDANTITGIEVMNSVANVQCDAVIV